MSRVKSGLGVLADSVLRERVTEWLYLEAELIDGQREREWLNEMVSKDLVYELPLRETVERSQGTGFVEGAYHLVETWGSLNTKLRQNETGFSWAEDPPSRTRHFVTNIRVGKMVDSEVPVWSNLLLYRSRQDSLAPQIFSGERQDILVEEDGSLMLKKRSIRLDTTAITAHNLAILF